MCGCIKELVVTSITWVGDPHCCIAIWKTTVHYVKHDVCSEQLLVLRGMHFKQNTYYYAKMSLNQAK